MNKNYILHIEGTSETMSDAAREKLIGWRERAVELARQHERLVYLNGPDERRVALTFDDGPDERITPMIAETLSRYGVKGNFFFVGSKMEQYPEVVKAVHEAGHLVLGHSYNHDRLTTLAMPDLELNFRQTQTIIRKIIGKEPAMFRPPFGDANENVIRTAYKEGLTTVLWSLDTLDWSQKEEEHIRWNVATYVRNGEIILMHSSPGCIETANALPRMIEDLQSKQIRIVDLAELLQLPAYTTGERRS